MDVWRDSRSVLLGWSANVKVVICNFSVGVTVFGAANVGVANVTVANVADANVAVAADGFGFGFGFGFGVGVGVGVGDDCSASMANSRVYDTDQL